MQHRDIGGKGLTCEAHRNQFTRGELNHCSSAPSGCAAVSTLPPLAIRTPEARSSNPPRLAGEKAPVPNAPSLRSQLLAPLCKCVAKPLAIAHPSLRPRAVHNQGECYSDPSKHRVGPFLISAPMQFRYPTFNSSHHFTRALRACPLILAGPDLGQNFVLIPLYDFYRRVHDANT